MTTAIMPIMVLGKNYLAVEETNGCTGCAARSGYNPATHRPSALCEAMPYCAGIIFVEAAGPALPGATLAEVAALCDQARVDGYAKGVAAKQAEWDKWAEGRINGPYNNASAMSRSTDPATSVKAAQDMDRKAGRIADLVLVALRDNNLTGKQLAANTGVALNSITPRFAQLARKGLIHAAPAQNSGRETVWALGNGVKV